MGCDIHIQVFVKSTDARNNGIKHTWIQPPPSWLWDDKRYGVEFQHYAWPSFRNYEIFGLLANVRSTVLSAKFPPRGLPKWAPRLAEAMYFTDQEGNYLSIELYYGDHSFSWLTLAELRQIPWTELNKHHPDWYAPSDLGWVVSDLIPMLEGLKSEKVSEDDIIVVFGFDS